MRIRSYTALLLYLTTFLLSVVARADQMLPIPVDAPSPGFGHTSTMAEHAGHLMPDRPPGCSDHQRMSDDGLPPNGSCQSMPDCSPDHCFSSQGLLNQVIGVIPHTGREYFVSGGYQLLSLVLSPPGRPPRFA
ncbi:hypothetical protein [Marinobacterium sediminicola]|uniref:hypothetical protein n=1 Tax=Marinobacterium sediminicola TaxID=518898 RepID=UPI001EF04D06|nr:hypothetical protein [Marinobacterium sediminicola]ULG68487.1 hypothetical protein LN244_12375 [Marinobacterium sediminicola]